MADAQERAQMQKVINTYKAMQKEIQQIGQKIGELQAEGHEHELVMKTISEVSPDRKCFRSVGGVLVERTVKDVIPAVKTNMDGILELVKALSKQIKTKSEAMEAFRVKYNIRINQQGNAAEQKQ